jgi:hypothetical protein
MDQILVNFIHLFLLVSIITLNFIVSSIRNEADRLLIEIEKNLSDKKVFLQLLKNKTEK